jgi:hypothetical protein
MLESNCKNNEYILYKADDEKWREAMAKSGGTSYEWYACKHNSREIEVGVTPDRKAIHLPVKSIDGKTYTKKQLQDLSDTNPNISIALQK